MIVNRYIQYEYAIIVDKHYTQDRSRVTFSNGDVWEAIKITSSCTCGKRINIAYIDRQIP